MPLATVLVVEDNPANMELVHDLLTVAGYRVLMATTAERAIELASTGKPDLVLMDIGLPGMDGLEATRRLKRNPTTAAIPIVCLTAHAMHGDEARARRAGCDGYLTKPLDARSFADTVAGFIVGIEHTLTTRIEAMTRWTKSTTTMTEKDDDESD